MPPYPLSRDSGDDSCGDNSGVDDSSVDCSIYGDGATNTGGHDRNDAVVLQLWVSQPLQHYGGSADALP